MSTTANSSVTGQGPLLSSSQTSSSTGKKKTKGGAGKDAQTTANLLRALPPPRLNENAADAFAKALLKKSLAHLSVSSGFITAEGAAFHALSQVTKHKILDVAEQLKVVAENSGRKQVIIDDFAECVKRPTSSYSSSREPLKYMVGIPKFPVDQTPTARFGGARDSESQPVPGLSHFPPLPPAHTYKRTRIEAQDIPASATADLRRTQQRNSALVRESLAKMRPRSNVSETNNASAVTGEVDNLARLLEGDFDA